MPSDEMQEALEADFQEMIDEAMFSGEVPTFSEILNALKELEREINGRTVAGLKRATLAVK